MFRTCAAALWLAVAADLDPPFASRASAVADLRSQFGQSDRAGLDLGVVGAGIQYRVSPMLDARALLLGLASHGAGADGRGANGGAGAELALRLVPFPRAPVRPFALGSAGVLLFPGGPFLQGGDVYDFMLQLGAGAEVAVGRAAIGADFHWVHLSNGQGLGAFNPAFGGVGVGVDVRWTLSDEDARWPSVEEVRLSGSHLPAVIVDGEVGHVDGWQAGARARVAERLAPWLALQLEGEAGTLDSAAFGEVGLAVVLRAEVGSLAAFGGYTGWDGLQSGTAQVQAEAQVAPEAAIVGTVARDFATLGNDWAAGLGIRAFPLDSLAVDIGLGAQLAGSTSLVNDLVPFFGLEGQLPLPFSAIHGSLFLERDISTLTMIGVRVRFGADASLRASYGEEIWRRLR